MGVENRALFQGCRAPRIIFPNHKMTSHGHGIARATQPRTPAQRDADLQKIAHYHSLESSVRDLVSRGSHGQDTFALTSKLLRLSPEYYTVWNVRRRCLISGDPSAS